MGFRNAKIQTNVMYYCYKLKASLLNYFCPMQLFSVLLALGFFFLQEYMFIVLYVFLNTGILY